jgi:primosomal protein N' (replication factor Y)
VARVALDVPLVHLDRPFDYLVPAELDTAAVPGCRVRVRFAGRVVDGFLLERVDSSDHTGTLAYLEKVVSPEPVLTPEIARLARAVADRYAGTLADVLRLAIPPRHARVESADDSSPQPRPAGPPVAGPAVAGSPGAGSPGAGPVVAGAVDAPARVPIDAGAWRRYVGGEAFLRALSDGPSVRKDALLTSGAPEGRLADARAGARPDTGTGARPDTGTGARPDAGAEARPDTGAVAPPDIRARAGSPPRAVLTMLPGEDWAARLAEAVAVTVARGRGVVAVVPDARDLERLEAAVAGLLGTDSFVSLHNALGPAERYRRFLRASRGQVLAVLGTRAAAFAPVRDLGLVVIWDDGDDLHAEPRAPYPHALQVLLLRAQLAGAGALVAATARSAEAQLLVETGWATELVAPRDVVRARAPAVAPTGDDVDRARDPAAATARLPSLAWRTARDALAAGAPVLVQVPRRGYVPAVSCVECHAPARCGRCAGPLELRSSHGVAACRWCGRPAADFACRHCGGRRLRASVVGAARTAEELGRAFPGVPVRTSGRDGVLSTVDAKPALVVATPGAEPVAVGGYGAVLLLDTWALLSRADLRAAEETLRRWLAAATLARPAAAGGRVVVVADGALATVQALLRWDPAGFAARELAERRELGFPPAARMASVTGAPAAVAELLALAALPDGAVVLGPVPVGPAPAAGEEQEERVLIRVGQRSAGPALAAALRAAAGVRSARKAEGTVRIQIDPRELW